MRLANPDHHREAITGRPLLLHGVARQTHHAGQTRLTVTSSHGRRSAVVAALRRITSFFQTLVRSAEQLSAEDRWRRILAEALKKYLRGRQPGRRCQRRSAGAACWADRRSRSGCSGSRRCRRRRAWHSASGPGRRSLGSATPGRGRHACAAAPEPGVRRGAPLAPRRSCHGAAERTPGSPGRR